MKKIFSNLWTFLLILFILSFFLISYVLYNGMTVNNADELNVTLESKSTVSTEDKFYFTLIKEVSENGWDDSNESLTKFVIENGEKVVETISDSTDLMNETIGDNKLFVYLKYLEFKKEEKKLYTIYVNIFKAFQLMGKDSLMLSSRCRYEEVISDKLSESIQSNVFSKKMKISLKKKLEGLLIIDKKLFLESIRYEYDVALDKRKKYFFKEPLTKSQIKIMELSLGYTAEYYNEACLELMEVVNESSIEELNDYVEYLYAEIHRLPKDLKKINLMHKLKNDFAISHSESDYRKLEKFQINMLGVGEAYIFASYFANSYSLYLERIQANKLILEQLSAD